MIDVLPILLTSLFIVLSPWIIVICLETVVDLVILALNKV